jgi:hypothetical protein
MVNGIDTHSAVVVRKGSGGGVEPMDREDVVASVVYGLAYYCSGRGKKT